MKWILILTLFSPFDGGTSIQRIDFATRGQCLSAANAWLSDVKRKKGDSGYAMIWSAVCAESGE